MPFKVRWVKILETEVGVVIKRDADGNELRYLDCGGGCRNLSMG